MSKAELILTQENHFSVVFEEGENVKENHKNNYRFFIPRRKTPWWAAALEKKCHSVLYPNTGRNCFWPLNCDGCFDNLKREVLNFFLFVF